MTYLLFKFCLAVGIFGSGAIVTDRHFQLRNYRLIRPRNFYLTAVASTTLLLGALVYIVFAYLHALGVTTYQPL